MYVPIIRQQTISLFKAVRLLAAELSMDVPSAAAIFAEAILDGHLKAKFHHKESSPYRVGSGHFVDLERTVTIPVHESSYALASLRAAINRDSFNDAAWSRIDIDKENLRSCCEFRGWELPRFWFQYEPVEGGDIYPEERDDDDREGACRMRSDALSQEIELICERAGKEISDAAIINILRARAGKADSCIKKAMENCLVWDRGGKDDVVQIPALRRRLSRRRKQKEKIRTVN